MADINVSPTRSELKRLNTRISTARRGYKLLKDKRDEMAKRFTEAVKEAFELRKRVERGIEAAHAAFCSASAVMSENVLNEALALPSGGGELILKRERISGVDVPRYSYLRYEGGAGALGYGYAFTSGELDKAVSEISSLVSVMIAMAEKEKCVLALADEMEKTRRRVNALEYIMIPSCESAAKRIAMKLDENERGATARLMKVKSMMTEKEIERKRKRDADI